MSGTLEQIVHMEALAAGRRRALARQTGATSHGGMPRGSDSHLYNWGEHIRQLADEMDRDEAEQRRKEAWRRLSTPSELIQRAMADWPNQDKAVRAYAKEHRISLGDAWRRTIKAGVEALRKQKGD